MDVGRKERGKKEEERVEGKTVGKGGREDRRRK